MTGVQTCALPICVWYATPADASAHQKAMHTAPREYAALAVSPLASGRLDPPDIALFYATPGAMMYFINGLQWSGYKRFDWSVVGESACADSWGRALVTGTPSLSIPCFAERRYGGVLDDELVVESSTTLLVVVSSAEVGASVSGLLLSLLHADAPAASPARAIIEMNRRNVMWKVCQPNGSATDQPVIG